MKNIFCIGWLLLGLSATLCAQKPKERIYVQTDKEFYLAGEVMLLKVHELDEHFKPLAFSRVAYVEILGNERNTVRTKVKLTGGSGTASIKLPHRLASGTYALVAYTRWMRNEGERVFFRKEIEVFNSLRYLPDVDKVTFTDTFTVTDIETEADVKNIIIKTDKARYGMREKVSLSMQNVPQDVEVTINVTRADARLCPGGMARYRRQLPAVEEEETNTYLPELEGMLVEGRWKPTDGKESVPAHPNLSVQGNSLHYYAGQSTGKGIYTFYTPPLVGMKEAVTGAEGNGHLELLSPYVASMPEKLLPVHLTRSMEKELAERQMAIQTEQLAPADTTTSNRMVEGYNRFIPRWSYDLDQYRRFPTFEETFIEFMPGVRTVKQGNRNCIAIFDESSDGSNQGNTLVLIDGVTVTNHEAVLTYNPRMVKWVDVYTGDYVFGDQYYNGILSLRTPNGNLAGFRLPDNSVMTDYEGVQPAAVLPQEVALLGQEAKHHPDLRHTLYWNPAATSTNQTVSFFTSDLCGMFVVSVEGIAQDGTIVYGHTSFEVE